MAEDHRRKVKSNPDSEGSLSESDVEEAEDANDAANNLHDHILVSGSPPKIAEGSEYESAEEEDENKNIDKKEEESQEPETQKCPPELLDEEGGEEGIADTDNVEGDFLSGDLQDDDEEEEEEDVADDDDSEEYVEEERQQGDGEECSPNAASEKELDFDEDRRNPQYIPKKGIFYEHDDRNNEDVKEKEDEPARDKKKKLWLDEGKWGHDRFREEEQYPKSRHELIETYGYDIRNEDGPPRARRRRRYGRGPTKYERSWEDVMAYTREKFRGSPRGMNRGRQLRGNFRGNPRYRGRGRTERNFENPIKDDVTNEETEQSNEKTDEEVSCNQISSTPILNTNEFPALPSKEIKSESDIQFEKRPFFQKSSSEAPESKSVRTLTFENSNLNSRNSIERDIPPRRGKATPFSNQNSRGNRKPLPRGVRGLGRGDFARRGGRTNARYVSPRFLEQKANDLNTGLQKLNLEDSNEASLSVQQSENTGISAVPPNDNSLPLKGTGDTSGRPKRYSSLRQRSLPESSSYQAPQQAVPSQHTQFYEAGYQPALYAQNDTGVPVPSTQSQNATSPPLINSAYQTFAPTPYSDSYGIRLPVTTPPPRLFPQATVPAGQPILAPPPCITPNGSLMNFAHPPPPPPPAAPYQFAYQQYAQPPPPPPPAPPNDMFQTGITYYYPQTQPAPIRPTVQKRPKAAIPILPPPERESKRNETKDSVQPSVNSNSHHSNSVEAASEEIPVRTETATPSLLPSVGVES